MNPKDLVGAKKAPLGVVPPSLIPFVAPAMAVGANKYGPFNWREQKVQAMTYAEALLRHVLAWIDGQDYAEDTGVHHLAHAMAGLAILADAMESDNLIDNRPKSGPTADILRAQDHSVATGDPKVYPVKTGPEASNVECIFCGSYPEHRLGCPLFVITSEPWGEGDGDVYEYAGGDLPRLYVGEPVEALDGCIEYRGLHIHPASATPATFREIDRDMNGLT